jgi:hypothetical protein
MNKTVTTQELKEQFEKNKNKPLPSGVRATCICGKHDVSKVVELSDEDYEEMARIINGEDENSMT